MAEVQLVPLESSDRKQFIKDNQEAFNYGAMEEFGLRDAHFEDKADEQIISSKTIEASIDSGEAYRIVVDGNIVGGTVIKVTGSHGELELLFIKPEVLSKGIGYASWCAIEKLHLEVTVWETFTPYFETRNIHFYVNRCGFHIVEYLNKHHTGDFPADEFESDDPQFPAGMFRFKKTMQAENRQKVFESDYAECYYIKNDNAVFHVWKKEAHYECYRNPVIASLTLLKEHPGSIFIVDAKNGFEDVKEDVEWGFTYFLPELKKTGCKIWGFILPKTSDIEGEIDLWTKEIEKNFRVIRAESYENILANIRTAYTAESRMIR